MMHRSTQRQRLGHRKWPREFIADKGYSSKRIRQWLKGHHIHAVIPKKKNETPDPAFDNCTFRENLTLMRPDGADA